MGFVLCSCGKDKFLEDFYYGNITPNEQRMERNSELKRTVDRVAHSSGVLLFSTFGVFLLWTTMVFGLFLSTVSVRFFPRVGQI